MARRPARRNNRVHTHDFTGVSSEGGGSFHIPPGDYGMVVKTVDAGVSKAGNEQYEWKFEGLEGKAKGKTFYFYTTWTPDSLWKLKQTLEALGFEVPDSPMDVDLDELLDIECVGTVEDNDYNGKINSKLSGIAPAEEAGRTSSRDKDSNGADKIEASEVEKMAEDELADLIKEHRLKVNLRSEKTLRRKAQAVVDALDEAGLLA